MTIIDDSKVLATLRNLERNLTGSQARNAFNRAARKGGNLLKDQVRSEIVDDGTFEHINFIKRSVKVRTSKSRKNPGVNVYIKGADVPVGQGVSRRFWKLSSYSNLVFFGNYKTPGRPTKSGSRRGNVKGVNPLNIFQKVYQSHGAQALRIARSEMVNEVQKEIAKSIVK